jgi:hypothetical protein
MVSRQEFSGPRAIIAEILVSDVMEEPELIHQPKLHVATVVETCEFLRTFWLRVVAISAVLLIPCFWHRHIESGDLASHTYNAWLVHLVKEGRAPGLWVKHIWNNVLFDWMLSGFTSIFGFGLGEKIAVSLAVLVLFWGVFAFVSAISRAAPWTLVPTMAMVAYGWTFQIGLFNYYLSIGLSFLALSILCVTRGWKRLYALAATPVIFFAHPLGLAWFLGASLYILIFDTAPQGFAVLLPATAGLLLLLIHKFMWLRLTVSSSGGSLAFYKITGLDQLMLYGHRYKPLAVGLFLFVTSCFLVDVVRRRREPGYWLGWSLPLQLFIVVELAVLLLPDCVQLSRYPSAITLLLQRLGLVAAVLMLALLGTLEKQKWHVAGFGLFAAVFFFFLYRDTARINSMETRVEQLVSELPFGTRVLATTYQPPGTAVNWFDVLDRVCIERCFSFGNYEASSGAFRVRALPGNGIVSTSVHDCNDIEGGNYVVKPQDLPMYQVYQCSPFITDLCIRKLEAGEKNDRLGVHP